MTEPSAPQRRLKIAFVVDRFGHRFGGAEAYGVELMRELSKTHDVTVFAREYDRKCGLALPYVPLRTRRGLPSWLRVLWFAVRAHRATRKGFDIVHSHMNGWCGDVEVVHVTPVRYNWRVRPLPLLKRWLSYVSPRVQTYLRLEARRVQPRPAHRTVAVSGLISDQLKKAYGEALNSPVIPPGVVPAVPGDPGQRQILREQLGWDDQACICLMVARNPMRKGLPTVLRALERLPEHYKLVVVGANREARDYLTKSPRVAALRDRVAMIKETSDVAPYYGLADVYVHPTLNDSFGMAPLEAMSYGLPVILSPEPWCGFAHYVEHGVSALLLDHPENDAQLAGFIEQVAGNADRRKQLACGAADVVEQHGWSRVAIEYVRLYRDILAERSQDAGTAQSAQATERRA